MSCYKIGVIRFQSKQTNKILANAHTPHVFICKAKSGKTKEEKVNGSYL